MSQREVLSSLDGRRIGLTADEGLTFHGLRVQEYKGDISTFAGTALTLTSEMTGSMIVLTSSSPVTITVPATLAIGFNVMLLQQGTGTVSPVAGSGMTLVNASGFTTLKGRYAVGSVVVYATASGVLMGDLA